jgi:hypothetical protein
MTPIEVWQETKPGISRLHVFGSDAYFLNQKADRDGKLDATGKPAIFLGYDHDNDSYYRVYDMESGRVVRSRDVRVYDNTFTMMAKLKEKMNDNNDNDEEYAPSSSERKSEIGEGDYLHDGWLTEEMLAAMFPAHTTRTLASVSSSSSGGGGSEVARSGGQTTSSSIAASPAGGNNDGDAVSGSEDGSSSSSGGDGVGSSGDKGNGSSSSSGDDVKVATATKSKVSGSGVRGERQSTRERKQSAPRDYDSVTRAIGRALMVVEAEPTTYKQAVASRDALQWKKAMEEELAAHAKNKSWMVVSRRSDMNVIGSKWVFKVKKNENGEVKRYKGRVVAKGYNQVEGIDYGETYAPVLKYKSLRLMLALAASNKHTRMEQLDIKTAFLNATISEDIYMEAPEGMSVKDGCVLKLLKAVYGI